MTSVSILVEGVVDEAVAARLVELSGHQVGSSLGKQGIGYIRKRIAAFNRAARGGVSIWRWWTSWTLAWPAHHKLSNRGFQTGIRT